jgi:metal-dependent amidase/aminoacylase/carboxypeptidase family protein
MIEHLFASVDARTPELVALRRDLHRHPELAFQEVRTAGIIAQRLEKAGLVVRAGVAQTGVVGILRGDRPGRAVLVRADIDALPIQESTGAAYASETTGAMHA